LEYKRLYILLEGNDDKRFFEKIIKPEFERKYDYVQFYRYAAQPPGKIANFIKSIVAMKADYIIMADINRSPCVTHKKDEITEKKIKSKKVKKDNIIVVIKEIESWYLAGLNPTSLRNLGINYNKKTDNLTKEQFDRLMPHKFISRIDFLQEILKHYELERAVQNNKSFHYFVKRFEI
jgi:hypothetical protein